MSGLTAKGFFTPEQREEIRLAIKNAELATSGEIRVHIESSCKGDVLDQAAWVFQELHMHETAQRNGVLIYLALRNRKFAIIGDLGINQKTGPDFWDRIKHVMAGHFRENRFTEGLKEAIRMAGQQLQTHFPYQRDDVNELSDEISFGK